MRSTVDQTQAEPVIWALTSQDQLGQRDTREDAETIGDDILDRIGPSELPELTELVGDPDEHHGNCSHSNSLGTLGEQGREERDRPIDRKVSDLVAQWHTPQQVAKRANPPTVESGEPHEQPEECRDDTGENRLGSG